MADDDKDLVSEVRIEGVDDATAKLEEYAAKGEDAFNKVAEAAKKSSDDVEEATKKIEESTKNIGDTAKTSSDKVVTASKKIADAVTKAGTASADAAKKVDPKQYLAWAAAARDAIQAGNNFGNSIRNTASSVGTFVTRMGAAIGIAGAVSVGILKLAQSVTKATDNTNKGISTQTKLQIANNNASLQSLSSSLNYEQSQKRLFSQLQSGAIEYGEYRDQLFSLRREYQEQIRTSAILQNAQEAVREENEKLKQQAADRAAYQALVNQFGGPLTNSLLALGRTVQQVSNEFRDTLGPVFSAAVDQINTQLQTFMATNGPQVMAFFRQLATGAVNVFRALLAAIPQLISLFNTVLLPVLRVVGAAFDQLAARINAIFGTNLTGSTLAFGAALLYVTGGFRVAANIVGLFVNSIGLLNAGLRLLGSNFGLIQVAIRGLLVVFSPWGLAITALVLALTALYLAVDWVKFGETIRTFVNNVTTWFAALPGTIGGFFQQIWDHIKDVATSLVSDVVSIFNGIIDWFVALPQRVVDTMELVKNSIVSYFTSAVNEALAPIQNFYNTVKGWFESLLSLIGAVTGAGGGENTTPGFKSGGRVTGHIRGAGTTTSDSIAAWLSNNEFVVRAKAVAKYGVGFLNAINSGRLNFADAARGYAVGGLVTAMNAGMSPSMSGLDLPDAGGSNNLRPFSLHIGNEVFDNLLAPEAVANKLVSFAVAKKTHSTGRKPSWMGSGS